MTQTNIIPFGNSNFPTHFADSDFGLNQIAAEFASVKFPVISIAAGRFHVKREKVSTLITRPKANPSDPDEPASYIDMVVLNLQKSKVFYLDGYTPGADSKPDCLSSDGITPDIGSEEPQCSTCALCQHNVWGSGTNDKGEATKGKACSDTLRLAVASPANLDDPFLLRVPPASLKNFAEMSKFVTSKRIPLNGAVVRISFDTSKTGILKFDAVGGLDAGTYTKAKAAMESDLVLNIVGKNSGFTIPAEPANIVQTPAVEPDTVKLVAVAAAEEAAKAEADKKAKVKAAKAAKLAAAQAALAAAQADEDGDDAEVAPVAPVAPAKVAKPKTPVATSDSFDDELAALLA